MAGAAKRRANAHKESSRNGSSSGETSTSGKQTHSVRSAGKSTHSRHSRHSGYDGSRDPESGSRPSSPSHSRNSSRSGSPAPTTSTEHDPVTARPAELNRNIDIPFAAYSIVRGQNVPSHLASRQPPSKLGNAIKVGLNTFHVESLPGKPVYQFDVLIGSGTEKRGLIKKLWASKSLKEALGQGFIFDGNKLAWSMRPLERNIELRIDMDKEQNRKPGKKDNKHRVVIKQTNRVRLDVLASYLEGQISINNAVLESINFLDHLIREWP